MFPRHNMRKRVARLTAEGPSMVERSSLAPTAVLVWLITPKLRVTSPPRQYGGVRTEADRGKQHKARGGFETPGANTLAETPSACRIYRRRR